MKKLITHLFAFLTLVSCNKSTAKEYNKNDILLGFEIGEPLESWKPKLTEYKNTIMTDTFSNGGNFLFVINEESYNIELNVNASTNLDDALESAQIVSLFLYIDSISPEVLNIFLEKNFGFNSIDVISKHNDSLEIKRKNIPINPITGVQFNDINGRYKPWTVEDNLLVQLREKSIWTFSPSWEHKGVEITVLYTLWNDGYAIFIEDREKTEIIESLSKQFINQYTLEDYILLETYDKDCFYGNNLTTVVLRYNVHRRSSYYDKRNVKKVKFNLIVKDEFDEEVGFFEDNVIDLTSNKNRSFGIENGLLIPNYGSFTFFLTQKISDCKDLKFHFDIAAVIMSDGTVLK
jgi:hypothetical protein